MKFRYSKLVKALAGCALFAGASSAVAGGFPMGTVTSTLAKEQLMEKHGANVQAVQDDSVLARLAQEAGVDKEVFAKSLAASLKAMFTKPQASASPGSSFGAPMGFGAGYGQAFVGLSGSTRDPSSGRVDGAAAFGFGLGDPNESVGVTVNFTVDSLDPADGGAGGDGSIGGSISRNLPWDAGVAVGVNRIVSWGSATGNPSSVYAAVSKIFVLRPDNPANPFVLTVSGGVGNGSFRSLTDQRGKKSGVGYFGSIGLNVHPRVSVILDNTGSITTAGVSLVPFTSLPVTLTAGAFDVGNRYNNQTTVMISLGYAFSY